MTPVEVLAQLVAHYRWSYKGYGMLSCPRCGALADETHDEGVTTITRIDQCSPSCIWRTAEELVDGISVAAKTRVTRITTDQGE